MFEIKSVTASSPQEFYDHLAQQAEALVAGEGDLVANSANLASLIYHSLEGLNWAGFYLLKGEELVLGPFQGRAHVFLPVLGMLLRRGDPRRNQTAPDAFEKPAVTPLPVRDPDVERDPAVGLPTLDDLREGARDAERPCDVVRRPEGDHGQRHARAGQSPRGLAHRPISASRDNERDRLLEHPIATSRRAYPTLDHPSQIDWSWELPASAGQLESAGAGQRS